MPDAAKPVREPLMKALTHASSPDGQVRPSAQIRVMLVDDQPMMRAGLRAVLECEPDLTVVAEAGDGHEALRLAPGARPDVVLMDVQMPGLDGIETTKTLLEADPPNPRIIILTTFDRDDYLFEALVGGASGFLLKNSPPEDLVDAVRVVASGDALLAPAVTRRVIDAASASATSGRSNVDAVARLLTEREADVLRLVAAGMSNLEIAGAMFVGESTVKTHVSNVLLKLDVRDRVQAVVWAYEHGFVRPGDR
jgi:DNA-binding NarL/FixJ family response regulator